MSVEFERVPSLRRTALLLAFLSAALAGASADSDDGARRPVRQASSRAALVPDLGGTVRASQMQCRFARESTDEGGQVVIPRTPPGGASGEAVRPTTDRMVDVGGRQLHVRVFGRRSPTVVLISGANVLQTTWDRVAVPLSETATVVTFDRAGYGKSEIGSKPAHARQAAEDLRRILDVLAVPGPYLIVGHSYGARVARIYASLFPEGMGGLVIVEEGPPGYLDAQETVLTGADLAAHERMQSTRIVPAHPRAETDYNAMSLAQAEAAKPLPRVPLLVLIAGAGRENVVPPVFSPDARRKLADLRLDMQKQTAAEIPGGRYIVFDELDHGMHLRSPDPIVRAIQEWMLQVR